MITREEAISFWGKFVYFYEEDNVHEGMLIAYEDIMHLNYAKKPTTELMIREYDDNGIDYRDGEVCLWDTFIKKSDAIKECIKQHQNSIKYHNERIVELKEELIEEEQEDIKRLQKDSKFKD